MASLSEIARDYRRSAELLRTKADELSRRDTSDIGMMEKYRLKRKISTYKGIAADMLGTANFLERYYEKTS